MVKRPNTTGCEPVIREFESHHSPHSEKIEPMLSIWFFLMLLPQKLVANKTTSYDKCDIKVLGMRWHDADHE